MAASTSAVYQPATFAAVLTAVYFSSLIPDIDQPTSSFWQKLPFGRVGGEIADTFLDHRNLTHSLLGLGLFSFGTYYLWGLAPDYWGINELLVWKAGMVAFGLHLLADSLTEEGIPLLWPIRHSFGLPPKPFAGVRIVTGKWFERLIVLPTLNLLLLLILFSTWSQIKSWLFMVY